MKIDYRRSRTPLASPTGVKRRDMSNLQQTQYEPDKSGFSSFQKAINVIHKGANARVRRGYQNIVTDNDIIAIHIYDEIHGNELYQTQKDGDDSKLVKVDRSTYAQTDILTGISGQGSPSHAALNGWFYLANGGSTIVSHNKSTSTSKQTLANGSDLCHLLASDESRLWGAFEDTTLGTMVLRFSHAKAIAEITSFAQSGTSIDRAGIANSLITKFNSLVGAGKYIVASGDNRTEVHRIPDFAGYDPASGFPLDVSTLVWSFNNVGTRSQHGMMAVDNEVFVVPDDGTLVKINVVTGEKVVYRDVLNTLEDLNVGDVALGYDQRNTLVLISCAIANGNDTVVAFNHQEGNFSEFTNIFADQWAFDTDNVYFYNSNQGLFDAFNESYFDDEGVPIDVYLLTQMNDLGDLDTYKSMQRIFLGLEFREDLVAEVNVYADRAVSGMFTPSFTREVSLESFDASFDNSNQSFGFGVWGAAGFNTLGNPKNEHLRTIDFVNVEGVRFELEFKCSVTEDFSVRGLGAYYLATSRPTNNIIFS